MAVSRDTVVILHIIWERDCNQPIHNLIKEAKAGISPSLFQCSPSAFV